MPRAVAAAARNIGAWLGAIRGSDPGWLRAIQAMKTGAAVLIALLILSRAGLQTRLFAGITAGFLMQCTSTGALRRRHVTMIVTAFAMAAWIALGAGVLARHPFGQDALLLVVAFVVFYVRRVLPDQSLFPVFTFVIALLAVALPAGWGPARAELIALAIGLAVAFIVHFYVFSPSPRRTFADALGIFAAQAAGLLAMLEAALRQRSALSRRQSGAPLRAIRSALGFNQQLVDQWGPTLSDDPMQGRSVTEPLLRQYECAHALGMLASASRQLTSESSQHIGEQRAPADELPDQAFEQLAGLVDEARRRFLQLRRGLRGEGGAWDELSPGPSASDASDASDASALSARWTTPSRDLGELQSVVLRAAHPLRPRLAHLFSSLVALWRLRTLQDQIARTMGPDGGSAADRASGASPNATDDSNGSTPAVAAAAAMPSAAISWGADLRTPLRAVVAVGIATVIWRLVGLERSYWAVLVSIFLVSGTWGENTQRGLTRFAMTVTGCFAAAYVLRLTHAQRSWQVAVMVGSIILAAYFRTASYPLLTFFVSLYIVILFKLIGHSPIHIVFVRSYETFIGCAIALAASIIVRPARSTRQWEQQLDKLSQSCRDIVLRALDLLIADGVDKDQSSEDRTLGRPIPAGASEVRELMSQVRTLRNQSRAAAYEGILAGAARRQRQQQMEQARRLVHHALGLFEAVRAPHGRRTNQMFRREFEALRQEVGSDLAQLPLFCFSPRDAAPELRDAPDDALDDSPGVAEPTDLAAAPRESPALDRIERRLSEQHASSPECQALPVAELAWLGAVIYEVRQILSPPASQP